MTKNIDCLIVEDNQDNMFICSHILDSLGFQSSQAETAEKALPMCHSKQPDLIILDWNLPGQSGINFLREIKENKVVENAKIIMCTAQGDMNSVRLAMAEGVDGYVVKPYKRETFSKQLQAIGLLAQ